MRVLVTSSAGIGHVLPMVPLALALQERGHTVLWATALDACRLVRAAGLTAVEAGLTDAEVDPARAALRQSLAGRPPEELPSIVFPRLFGEVRTPPMVDALLPLAREWRPDLVVHEHGELAAPLVATLLGVPHAVHAFGGGIPAPILAETTDRLAPLWSAHGLEVPPHAGCYQHLYLDICPTSLQTVPLDHVGERQPVRTVLRPAAEPMDLDAVLPPGGAPLVYLTLGTVSNRAEALAVPVRAVAGLPVRLLVTAGPGVDPADLGPQPGNVRVQRWVPQAEVLPRCAAVVSHAGSGTVLATASLGIPQVCLPQAADQFRNAAGVDRAGAGVWLHPSEATEVTVAAAVEAVLGRPDLRAGAERVRDEMAAMPSPDAVAERLERLS